MQCQIVVIEKAIDFERKVKKTLEDNGWVVFRQGKSAFPDLVCIKNGVVVLVECKMNKYISKKEKKEFAELRKHCPCFVAWKPGRGKIDYYQITEEYLNG